MTHKITRFWLVRHAPVIGAEGRIYGQDDLPADCGDETAFANLARFLPHLALWLVSPLQRTHQTLSAIDRARPQPGILAVVERDLIEQHFGDWQGLTYDELAARRDGAYHRFWHAPASERPPNGESFADVVARVAGVLDRLSRDHTGADFVAIIHGGSIRAALAAALGIDPERALGFAVDTLSVTRVDRIEGASEGAEWSVAFVNRRP